MRRQVLRVAVVAVTVALVLFGLPLAVVANSEVFIVVHPDLKDAARVRVVLDQIVALFERDVRSLSGLG